MSKQNISATLEADLLKKLDSLAEETERYRSWLISKALENYFEELNDVRVAQERLHEKRLSPAALRREIGL